MEIEKLAMTSAQADYPTFGEYLAQSLKKVNQLESSLTFSKEWSNV